MAFEGIGFRWLLALSIWAAAAFPALAETIIGKVIAVHDGDTLTLDVGGRRQKVRLCGIDAPEIGQTPWDLRSRDFARKLALGQVARVETDVQARDKYRRLLGYVYVGNTFVNLELIRNGHAVLLTYPPNVAHAADFTRAQQEARQAGAGIWNPTQPLDRTPYAYRHPNGSASPLPASAFGPETTVRFNKRSHKYHTPGCGHPCQTCVPMTKREAELAGGRPCKQPKR